jgi:hypothetical protein
MSKWLFSLTVALYWCNPSYTKCRSILQFVSCSLHWNLYGSKFSLHGDMTSNLFSTRRTSNRRWWPICDWRYCCRASCFFADKEKKLYFGQVSRSVWHKDFYPPLDNRMPISRLCDLMLQLLFVFFTKILMWEVDYCCWGILPLEWCFSTTFYGFII